MTFRLVLSMTALAVIAACQSARLDLPTDTEIDASRERVVDAGEIIVVTPSRAAARNMISKAVSLGYEAHGEEMMTGLGVVMLTLEMPEGQDGASAIRELESWEPSAVAGVNHAYTTQAISRRGDVREYAETLLGWKASGCSATTRVGLLDTAIAPDRRYDVTSADFSRNAGSPEPAEHGTAILDLLFAPGMLDGLEVFHADVVSATGRAGGAAGVDTMLRGLDWLVRQDVRLVNVSLSGPYNKILDIGFQRAGDRGVILVAAAGNDGPGQSVRYPAALDSTLAVTAVDAARQVYTDAVRGEALDFSAPGVDVFLGVNGQGRYFSGTSIAAPFVTLSLAGDPRTPALQDIEAVRRVLLARVRDLGTAGHDRVYGHGLISAPGPCAAGGQAGP